MALWRSPVRPRYGPPRSITGGVQFGRASRHDGIVTGRSPVRPRYGPPRSITGGVQFGRASRHDGIVTGRSPVRPRYGPPRSITGGVQFGRASRHDGIVTGRSPVEHCLRNPERFFRDSTPVRSTKKHHRRSSVWESVPSRWYCDGKVTG